jgi:hypothetical protein
MPFGVQTTLGMHNAFHFIMISMDLLIFLQDLEKKLNIFFQISLPQYYSRKVIECARGYEQSDRYKSSPASGGMHLPVAGTGLLRRSMFIDHQELIDLLLLH